MRLGQIFDMLQGRKSTPFGLMYAIAFWASNVPYVNTIAGIALIVFMILWFYEYNKRVVELVENRQF